MVEKNRILVVEDDALVSEVIAAALGDTYSTTVVGTAAQATALLRKSAFELMLLDCTLPGGAGADLITEADKIGVPVVMMSGDPSRMTKLVEQPRPFVLKPFSLDDLLKVVGSVMSSRNVGPLDAGSPAGE